MKARYFVWLAVAASLAAAAGAVPPHEIEATVVPVLGWGPGVELTFGFAAGRKGEVVAGLGYNFVDVALDITDSNSKSHGFARAKFGYRYYTGGGLRGFYLQPEVGFHYNFFELYTYVEPRGFRDHTAFSTVPAFLVGGRWVVGNALSLRAGGGAGFQVPWDFGNNGTFPVFPRVDICMGYAF